MARSNEETKYRVVAQGLCELPCLKRLTKSKYESSNEALM